MENEEEEEMREFALKHRKSQDSNDQSFCDKGWRHDIDEISIDKKDDFQEIELAEIK